MTVELVLAARAEHAEGPIWDAATRALWWVDITGHRVHCFHPDSNRDCSWDTGCDVGAIAVGSDGNVVLAVPDGFARFDPKSGTLTPLASVEASMPENRTNDATCDSAGRLWVGTMAYDRREGHAGLYVLDPDLTVRQVESGLTIVNGPAFDDARGRMYLADTAVGLVYAYSFDPAAGQLGAREVFVDLSASGSWPDGMTVDDEGGLWVAVGRDSAVHRYLPDGRLDKKIGLPVTNPTSVAFGGEDGSLLYITTSWYDLSQQERARQPLAGSIFVDSPGVNGPPAHRFGG